MKALVFVALLLALFAPRLAAAPITEAPFVYIGSQTTGYDDPPPVDFFHPQFWLDGRSPGVAPADVIVRGPCQIYTDRARLAFVSFAVEARSRVFVRETTLAIERDVRVRSGTLELQKDAQLTAGGGLHLGETTGRGRLAVVDGLSKSGDPRVRAAQLRIGEGSSLSFRWLFTLPEGLPGNSSPIIEVAEDVQLPQIGVLSVAFENPRDGLSLVPGNYLLISATRIDGPLPRLTLTDAPGAPKLDASLQLNPERTRLSLVLSAAP